MGQEFPPVNRLGYSLNMLTVTPLSIKAVDESIKKARKILKYYTDEDTREVKIGGVTYDVPRCIGVSTDIGNYQGSYMTYRTGTEASSSFEADASLSIRYMCVSGGASASYALEKSLRQENQHAFYSFNADIYSASLRDWADLINESALKKRTEELPHPFDGNNPEHEKEYREFFESFGSHVITYCTYGARCQLNVWASNSESSVNQRFSVSVTASYNGTFNGGDFQASVKNEEQYKEFQELKQADVTAQGGDPEKAVFFIMHPDQPDAYDAWGKTTTSNPNVTSFSTTELWSVLREADSKKLREAADDVENAYKHLRKNPEIHKTKVTMTIESDWAEFGLLTPSAVITTDPDYGVPYNTVFSETKFQWGKEHSHQYERKDVRFIIVNDGSPVDFYISHGSNGGAPGKGQAMVLMEGSQQPYKNDKITDNNWNTMWFYQKSVSPKVEDARSVRSPELESRIWDATLTSYLREIGHYEALQAA